MSQSSLSTKDLNYPSDTKNDHKSVKGAKQTHRLYTKICIIRNCENSKGTTSSCRMFR